MVVTTTGDPGQARADLADKSFFVDITQVKANVNPPKEQGDASTGTFTVDCGVNENGHFNPDNFIAQPGVKNGAQHLHDYVGNLTTNADSSNQSLQKGGTTCKNGDKSAYFWPVIRIDKEDGEAAEGNGGQNNQKQQQGQQNQGQKQQQQNGQQQQQNGQQQQQQNNQQNNKGDKQKQNGADQAQDQADQPDQQQGQNRRNNLIQGQQAQNQDRDRQDQQQNQQGGQRNRNQQQNNDQNADQQQNNKDNQQNGQQNQGDQQDQNNNDQKQNQDKNQQNNNQNQNQQQDLPGVNDQNELAGNDGEIQRPASAELTFRGSPTGDVVAMPKFLRILYGDAKVNTNGPKNARDSWTCAGFEDKVLINKYPVCPGGAAVKRIHDFPSCWDGKNTDSANHRDHIVFPDKNGQCKQGFKAVPQLRITLTYNIPEDVQKNGQYKVDSFPEEEHDPFSDHDDFANVMSNDIMNRVVNCINDGKTCKE